MPEIKFELRIRDNIMNATVNLPSQPIRPVDLLPVLQNFSNAIIGAAIPDDVAISCKPGCAACCRQMVPLTETEAFYLAALIESMPPERQAALKSRFASVLDTLQSAGMLDRLRPEALTEADVRLQAGVDYFKLFLACPFLENENCGIYPHRPLSCREYLVTSPPANCAAPSPETIDMVPMPTRVSYVLHRFGDGKGRQPVKVITLPLLLEFASQNSVEDQPLVPAPQLFENFFREVTGS